MDPSDDELTIGVEEEFLLIDPDTGQLVPRAADVVAELAGKSATATVSGSTQIEFTQYQVETRTPVCHSVGETAKHLERLRADLVAAAARHGARPISTGSPVLPHPMPPPHVDDPRYHRIADRFGTLTDTHTICGCHVHIGLADRSLAVAVSNHLRPWLPLLLALSANSPFDHGRDTGYASWRAVLLCRWPGASIPPWFDSLGDYDRSVRWLLDSGAALDRGMVYWHIRPSHHLPTLEIRVFDAAVTVTETVLFAALTRALVGTALRDIRDGRPPNRIAQHDLHVALWSVARTGMSGPCLDPGSGEFRPAGALIGRLLDHIRPALTDSADVELVVHGLAALHRNGSGAARQRAAYARRESLTDVLTHLADHVLPPPQPLP